MNSRYVYPFAYLLRQHDLSRRVRAFQIRDGAASLEIVTALAYFGWQYGGLLLNYPKHPPQEQETGELLPVDHPRGPNHLVFTATRPPIDECGKKRVQRGFTDLEARIFQAWRPYFKIVNRHEVELSMEHRTALEPGFEDRAHIFFRQLEGSRYHELGTTRYRNLRKTAAFLLHVPALEPGSCGYLGIFGMDGTTTLIWAHLLATRHRDLLAQHGFVMAELEMAEIPERPTSLGFAQGWRANVILQVPA